MRAVARRWISLTLAGAALMQFWSCIGPDPVFFLTNTFATTITSLTISEIIRAIFTQAGAAGA